MNEDCKHVKSALPLYIDGQLEEEEAKIIKTHLEVCENCRKDYEFHLGIMKETRKLPEIFPSAQFESKLQDAIEKEKEKKRFMPKKRYRFVSGVAAIAAALVIAFVGVNKLSFFAPQTGESSQLSETGQSEDIQDMVQYNTAAKGAQATEAPAQAESSPAMARMIVEDTAAQKNGICFTFTQEGYENAYLLLEDFEREYEVHFVPNIHAEDIAGRLESLEGFISKEEKHISVSKTAEKELGANYTRIKIQTEMEAEMNTEAE